VKKFENAFRINTVIPIALVDKAKRGAREQGIKVSELQSIVLNMQQQRAAPAS
jgi:hypothetical protein